MSKILVVDDSPVDRLIAGKLIEKHSDMTPIYAADGREALLALSLEKPDAVVTDLQMPGMNGLDLVLEVRLRHPFVPVILMTAHGSEDLAVQALKRGAASYVPKRELADELVATVEEVLEAAKARQGHSRVMECITRTESHFLLDNDPTLIPPLVDFLKANVFRMSGSDDTGLIRVTMALRAALLNAMEHGNLELDSALRGRDEQAYHALAQERRGQKPYMDRRVHVISRETPVEAMYVIRDEGPGFDASQLPDPATPLNAEKRRGRGLFLIRMFMSEVCFNDRGNEIVMTYRNEGNELLSRDN
jgi:CheY-like chemotaxis protein